jgi:serine/threonine protein kinase
MAEKEQVFVTPTEEKYGIIPWKNPFTVSDIPGFDVRIHFRAILGTVVAVMGDCKELGEWKSEQVVKLKWTDGDYWIGRIDVSSVACVEYKYIIWKKDNLVRWEGGGNRKVDVTCHPFLEDCWRQHATDAGEVSLKQTKKKVFQIGNVNILLDEGYEPVGEAVGSTQYSTFFSTVRTDAFHLRSFKNDSIISSATSTEMSCSEQPVSDVPAAMEVDGSVQPPEPALMQTVPEIDRKACTVTDVVVPMQVGEEAVVIPTATKEAAPFTATIAGAATEVTAVNCVDITKRKPPRIIVMKWSKLTDNETAARRTLRELHLLRIFDSPNVVRLLDVMTIPDREKDSFTELYVAVEHFDCHLESLIANRELEDIEIKAFIYDLFKGLLYIHSAGAVHRDLSPVSCLLVLTQKRLMLSEFGLARPVARDGSMSKDTWKLEFRAPEVIVDRLVYGFPLDLWAAGVMLAQCFTRKPLLDFGVDELPSQIEMVISVVGTPAEDHINRIADPYAKEYVKTMKQWPRAVRAKAQVDAGRRRIPEAAQQLIDNLVVWNPAARLPAAKCLNSPFFEDVRRKDTEVLSAVVVPPQFDFEVVRMKSPAALMQHFRRQIVEEMQSYHFKD